MFLLSTCNEVQYFKRNSMNVILGLCHSYSGKVVTFQESFFACETQAFEDVTSAQAIGAVASSSQTKESSKACVLQAKKRLLKGDNFSTISNVLLLVTKYIWEVIL